MWSRDLKGRISPPSVPLAQTRTPSCSQPNPSATTSLEPSPAGRRSASSGNRTSATSRQTSANARSAVQVCHRHHDLLCICSLFINDVDPFCHPSCNGRCWMPNDASACQKVCTSACGDAGCRDDDFSQCCSSTCFGGCFADGSCKSCADGYVL